MQQGSTGLTGTPFALRQVLLDPKQKRYFTAKNIRDLFTLGEENAHCTETEKIFNEVDGGIRVEDYAPAEIPPLVGERGMCSMSRVFEQLTAQAVFQPAVQGRESVATDSQPRRQDLTAKQRPKTVPARLVLEGLRGTPQAAQVRRHIFARNAQRQLGLGYFACGLGLLMHFKPPAPEADDAKILKDLMDGPGLHTAMDHAKIEGASAHDREIIDQEAARVAQQVRRSGLIPVLTACRNTSSQT